MDLPPPSFFPLRLASLFHPLTCLTFRRDNWRASALPLNFELRSLEMRPRSLANEDKETRGQSASPLRDRAISEREFLPPSPAPFLEAGVGGKRRTKKVPFASGRTISISFNGRPFFPTVAILRDVANPETTDGLLSSPLFIYPLVDESARGAIYSAGRRATRSPPFFFLF